jgi:hypothetical protein
MAFKNDQANTRWISQVIGDFGLLIDSEDFQEMIVHFEYNELDIRLFQRRRNAQVEIYRVGFVLSMIINLSHIK